MMKTRWGVFASTGIARRRTIPEGIAQAANAELTAVYSTNQKENQAVASQYGARACSTEEELLASDCDIVYIASPNHAHLNQVIKAAEAGKHIFCEKPLGLSVEEAERMVDACRQKNVKLGVAFMMRFHAYHQEALRLIQAGRLGKPVLARAQLSCWYPAMEGAWRQHLELSGGGSLIDMGSHCIDLLEMLFGKVKKLACFTGNLVQNYPSEDTAAVLLEFENGAKGFVDSCFNIQDVCSRNRLELYGSQGSILAEGTIGQGDAGKMTSCLQETDAEYEAQQTRQDGGGKAIELQPVNTYRAEVEAFSQAVLDNTEPPVGAEIGLRSQKIIAACYQSAKSGQVVEV